MSLYTFIYNYLELLDNVHCATSRTVPGSIPGGVTGFFSDIFSSDQTMALGSIQPLVKMSTRNIPGGKGGRCIRLRTYHHTVPLSRNLGALTSLDPSGPARPVTGVLYLDNGRRSSEHVADKLYKIRGDSLKNRAVSVLVYVT